MDDEKMFSKILSDEFHKNIVIGNCDEVNKLIKNGANIYKGTSQNESPLQLALLNQHPQIAAILWSLYKNDLKFIEQSLQDGDHFWTTKPILIAYGAENIASFIELYDEYRKCENEHDVNKNKCVVFLLKRDNLTPEHVLCCTPKSETGRMLTIRMIKCVLPNGVLDLQAQSNYFCSIIDASARSGACNIFDDLVNFGIESDHTNIVLKAILYGHVEFLEMFYKKFPTSIYEFFRRFCCRILGSNNWAVFKYYAEKIIAEKEFTWTEIVNYRLPFRCFTVLQYLIQYDLIAIVEPLILTVNDCQYNFNENDNKGHSRLLDLKWNYTHPEPYQRITMKIIESYPTQLQLADESNNTICHKVVSGLSLPELVRFFVKYPDAKKIFFKSQDIAFKFIGEMMSRKHFDTIKYLIVNSDEDLNKDLLYGVLNRLARSNNIELFACLMSLAEYDFTAPTAQQEYPIITALENHNLEVFKMIWSQVKNDDLSHLFFDLLRCAIQKPEYDQLFDDILKRCSNLNNLLGRDKSLFHCSAIADNLHAAKALLKHGLAIEFKYTEGTDYDALPPTRYAKTVEMFKLLNVPSLAVTRNQQLTLLFNCMLTQTSDETLKLVAYLIQNGCDINEIDENGRSCIYYATNPDIAKCLLKYGASLNCIDATGNTPIHFAFITNRPNVAYVLLEDESVDYSIRNSNGWSYLRCLVVEQYYYGDLKGVLSKMNSKLRTYLVEHCNDSCGQETPLILAALKNNIVLSGLLLNQPSLNVFVHYKYNRNTLLHVAMLHERVDVVDFLIYRGLKINEQNVVGDTPLNVYCRFRSDICEKVLKRYMKHSPDVRIKNNRGLSPILNIAAKDSSGVAVCELLAHGASLMEIGPENCKRAFDHLTARIGEMFKFLLDE